MSDVGQVRGPQPNQVQGGQQVQGNFAGFKVAVGEAFAKVGEAFKSIGTAIAKFFTSLFSMTVRQAPLDQPRVGTMQDPTAERMKNELETIKDDRTVSDMVPVQGRDDLSVSWIFARDLQGSGRHITIDGDVIVPTPEKDGEGKDIPWTKEQKVAFIANGLAEKFGPGVVPLLTQYANQGGMAAMETTLGSPLTPLETMDGRKVFVPFSDERSIQINFSQGEDGSMRLTMSQELRGITQLIPVGEGDTGDPPQAKGGEAWMRSSYDIILRPDGNGGFRVDASPLRVESDLGV